jgi:glycosyltransferase involved in cell wall biosynthesis
MKPLRQVAPAFRAATVILPVLNEEAALCETVEILASECGRDLERVLFVICPNTRPGSQAICRQFAAQDPQRYVVVFQKLPGLGGAFRTGLENIAGSHTVLMYSDMESDPHLVAELICLAKQAPRSIFSASRWIGAGGTVGYPPLKGVLNRWFQRVFAKLYRCAITDFTYGFRIYPNGLLQAVRWEETGHAFVFESILKPLLAGASIVEVPAIWRARRQGPIHFWAMHYWRYLRIGLRLRWRRREDWLLDLGLTHRNPKLKRRGRKP